MNNLGIEQIGDKQNNKPACQYYNYYYISAYHKCINIGVFCEIVLVLTCLFSNCAGHILSKKDKCSAMLIVKAFNAGIIKRGGGGE